MLDSIVYFHHSTTDLCYSNQKIVKNGRTYKRRSTSGWQLCCQWKDGSTFWKKLADLKESHPIETAKYAIYQNMQGETTFDWQVPHVIKKRKRIILLVNKCSALYLKKTHKFGVRLPNSLYEAYNLDT